MDDVRGGGSSRFDSIRVCVGNGGTSYGILGLNVFKGKRSWRIWNIGLTVIDGLGSSSFSTICLTVRNGELSPRYSTVATTSHRAYNYSSPIGRRHDDTCSTEPHPQPLTTHGRGRRILSTRESGWFVVICESLEVNINVFQEYVIVWLKSAQQEIKLLRKYLGKNNFFRTILLSFRPRCKWTCECN